MKSKPTLPLEQYAGRYVDAWYGAIAIESGAQGTQGQFHQHAQHGRPPAALAIRHLHRALRRPNIEPAYVTFAIGAEGKVERITMKPVSPIADFSFDYQDLLFTPAP